MNITAQVSLYPLPQTRLSLVIEEACEVGGRRKVGKAKEPKAKKGESSRPGKESAAPGRITALRSSRSG